VTGEEIFDAALPLEARYGLLEKLAAHAPSAAERDRAIALRESLATPLERERRMSRFVWQAGDLSQLNPDGTEKRLWGDPPDEQVKAAVEAAAISMQIDALQTPITSLGEIRHLTPAFRAALAWSGIDYVLPFSPKLTVVSWEPPGVRGRLGGFDVAVGIQGDYGSLFELKWASSKHEVGWTLWDIFKLAAARIEYGAATYAVVGAPTSYWNDADVACSSLYCDGIWTSRDLFARYATAWSDLLTGGTARPARVPATITTSLVATASFSWRPTWQLRALRVEAVDAEWLEFEGDWPVAG
jgi:hypothetical protein